MRKLFRILISFTLLSLVVFPSVKALAQDNPFVNGSFETGDFTGWTVVREQNSGGNWFVYSGKNFSPLPPPPDGIFAATSAQGGPSSQVLYQDVDVPVGFRNGCSLTYYYENSAEEFFTGSDLSYVTEPNQQARIDIMDPSAGDFDVGAGVLENLFQTNPGDPPSLGYTKLKFDLSPYAGTTVRFRVAEVDNQSFFYFAIDNVRCGIGVNPIPTLGEWGLITMAGVLGLAGLVYARRKRTLAA